MELKLSQKVIEERCGAVSYKRGAAFYRNGKVALSEIAPNSIKATVNGAEDFQVNLEKKHDGFAATCSCPTLSSVKHDCQHVAAVLILLQHRQQEKQGIRHALSDIEPDELSEGLLQLFGQDQKPVSARRTHFEDRKVLDTAFICKAFRADGKERFGIALSITSNKITDIYEFLSCVKDGRKYTKESPLYDPGVNCFDRITDAIIQLLIQVMDDEKIYHPSVTETMQSDLRSEMLVIPASFWRKIESLLIKAPQASLEYDGVKHQAFQVTDESLPLRFEFKGDEKNGFKLSINGLDGMMILKEYDTVLSGGKVNAVKRNDAERLYDLREMLKKTKTNEMVMPRQQLKYYVEQLLPQLRKIGEVHLSGEFAAHLHKTPLRAKLYIDRVHNRLLAGLEFHYESVIINPLDNRKPETGSIIIRDIEKEETILQLMKESKLNQTESGYYLQNEELEYNFLYHKLPKLQRLVQVYATTAVRTRISSKTIIPKIKVKHYKERSHLLEFTFSAEGIPETEIKGLLEALEEKRKYYRLRDGALLSLETKEMEEIQHFLHEAPVQDDEWEQHMQVPVAKGLRLVNYLEDSELVSKESSFRDFLQTIQQPAKQCLDVPVPDQLHAILREYQKQGFYWMKTLSKYGFGGILADDMGLGKTLQSIAFILSELPVIRKTKRPALVVCPSSVTYNWLNECMKFTPEIEAIVLDKARPKRIQLQKEIADIDLIITSYPLLRSDLRWYMEQKFHVIFFDEAQMVKNPLTQTARAVKKLQSSYCFALTGTPMENALEELWSIFHVVFPELFLGMREYSELTNKQIARRIRPFMLRRVKGDVLEELPEKKESIARTELLPEQKTLYVSYLAKLRHKTFRHLDKDTVSKNRIKILAGITRLRQICCHPGLFVDGYEGSSAKFEQLIQMIEDAGQAGRRILIFSQFTKMLQLIGQEITYRGMSYFYLDGQTPAEERVSLCASYNAGERDIFLISLKAGGTGLNLTGADTVIFYDSWWNPAVEDQAADRAHRMGQKQTVQVIKLVAKGTIEEKMLQLKERKRYLINDVIDPNDKQLSMLTEEDILDLLS